MLKKVFNIIKKNINIKVTGSKTLFTKLFNILYFETIPNGFFFFIPSLFFIFHLSHLKICTSPLVHLLSLVLKAAYDVGYPSINIISDAKPHFKYEPSIKS